MPASFYASKAATGRITARLFISRNLRGHERLLIISLALCTCFGHAATAAFRFSFVHGGLSIFTELFFIGLQGVNPLHGSCCVQGCAGSKRFRTTRSARISCKERLEQSGFESSHFFSPDPIVFQGRALRFDHNFLF